MKKGAHVGLAKSQFGSNRRRIRNEKKAPAVGRGFQGKAKITP